MGLFKKKDPIVEVEKALDHEVHEMEHDIQADVDAVMKKYDRESNTRVWEGGPKIALRVLMSAFSVYCILMTLFSKALPVQRLPVPPVSAHDLCLLRRILPLFPYSCHRRCLPTGMQRVLLR